MPRGALVGPGNECGQPCRGLGIQASGRVSSESAIPLLVAFVPGACCDFLIAITEGPDREGRSVGGSSAVYAALPIHRSGRTTCSTPTFSGAPWGVIFGEPHGNSWPGPTCQNTARTTSLILSPLAVHLGDAVPQGPPQSNCVRQVAFGLAVHAVVQKFAA